MFKKILIANRGEIALRVIRACKEMGILSVAVYSEADKDSLHVYLADEAICIGPPRPIDSYLNIPAIISAIEVSNADAVHPGYGFLSENYQFAEIVEACGVTFIGPSPQTIRMMGDKTQAKIAMKNAGVPLVKGSDDGGVSKNQALSLAQETGYPVILKAAAGGGGRGMRIAWNQKELGNNYDLASQEAMGAFGDKTLYLEKYIEQPRHIEFQILADNYGNCIHLGERECSIQRRHQKLIEESPCVDLSEEQREKIGDISVKASQAIQYRGAGTMEYLMDSSGELYFIEMNTRVQVEHPVTELITGIDIVKEQIRIAYGETLRYKQEDITLTGHAIECRINAEDPNNNFQPSPGVLKACHFPGGPGVRMDTHCFQEYTIPAFYDSLMAKLIVYGRNREEAILILNRALDEVILEGISTTVPLLQKIIKQPDFIEANIHTHFLDHMDLSTDQ